MKKVVVAGIISAVIAGFVSQSKAFRNEDTSAARVALDVVSALQQSSAKAYVALVPSVDEIHQLMKQNTKAYGPSLEPAMAQFASEYDSKIIPAVETSFNALLAEGRSKGIDWSKVRYVSYEYAKPENPLEPGVFGIIVSENGKLFRIQVEKAFFINGQWKVGKYLKLIEKLS